MVLSYLESSELEGVAVCGRRGAVKGLVFHVWKNVRVASYGNMEFVLSSASAVAISRNLSEQSYKE